MVANITSNHMIIFKAASTIFSKWQQQIKNEQKQTFWVVSLVCLYLQKVRNLSFCLTEVLENTGLAILNEAALHTKSSQTLK